MRKFYLLDSNQATRSQSFQKRIYSKPYKLDVLSARRHQNGKKENIKQTFLYLFIHFLCASYRLEFIFECANLGNIIGDQIFSFIVLHTFLYKIENQPCGKPLMFCRLNFGLNVRLFWQCKNDWNVCYLYYAVTINSILKSLFQLNF